MRSSTFQRQSQEKGCAETACGGILRRLGLVKVQGQVDGNNVEILWNHMHVKCPILSVLRLAQDGNEVIMRQDGGEIVNVETGKRLPFFQHNGVYYLKLKVNRPNNSSDPPSVFSRRG